MRIYFLVISHWHRIVIASHSDGCFHLFASFHIDVHRSALIPCCSAHEAIRVDSSRFVSVRFTHSRIEFALTSYRFAPVSDRFQSIDIAIASFLSDYAPPLHRLGSISSRILLLCVLTSQDCFVPHILLWGSNFY